MNDELKVIDEVQQRTAWTQSWWAVTLVALGIGSSLALTKLSWSYTLDRGTIAPRGHAYCSPAQ